MEESTPFTFWLFLAYSVNVDFLTPHLLFAFYKTFRNWLSSFVWYVTKRQIKLSLVQLTKSYSDYSRLQKIKKRVFLRGSLK